MKPIMILGFLSGIFIMGGSVSFSDAPPENHRQLASRYYQAGVTQMHEKKYEEAIESFKQAIEIVPNEALFHQSLGRAYLDRGNPDQAIASFERSIELDPRMAESYTSIGTIHASDRKDMETAEGYYRKALELQPNFAPALGGLAFVLLFHKEDPAAAVKYFEKSIQLNPESPEILFGLGMSYIALNQTARALGPISQLRILNRPDLAESLESIIQQKRSLEMSPSVKS